ncbi:MAG: hypothetical protein HY551_06915 [Elusimicrobia bacterium]|nr:hypothetical protein [Elusimicrobiota bacterium]
MRHGIAAWLLSVFIGPAFGTPAAGLSKQPQSGQLKDIVIEGAFRIQIQADKPSNVPPLIPKEPLSGFLKRNMEPPNPANQLLLDLPVPLPQRADSDVVLSPWRKNLWEPPLTIYFPTRAPMHHWRMVITSDRGRIFRTLKGRGRLPEKIMWDGLGDSGEPLQVGHPYSYSLIAVDKAQVPTYLSSKNIQLGSFVDLQPGGVRVFIDTRLLFTLGPALSRTGLDCLKEILFYVRKHAGGSIRVDVHGEDADLAQRQADLIRRNLESTLHLNEGSIAARGVSVETGGYSRTEILAR